MGGDDGYGDLFIIPGVRLKGIKPVSTPEYA